MAHTYNPSTLEAEAPGASQNFSVGSTIAWEKCETLSPKDKKKEIKQYKLITWEVKVAGLGTQCHPR